MQDIEINTYYDFNNFIHKVRGDGRKSKMYHHWCSACSKDRGFAFKNKILREPMCHSCKMKQTDVLEKISKSSSNRKHSLKTKAKISSSLYLRYGTNKSSRKIARNLRARLSKAVNGNYRSGSAVRDLGCSIEEFKKYLESQFQESMSWDNYGRDGWHIDHIVPLCRFNLHDQVELKKACHYSNLQPLWAEDNLLKRKKDGTYNGNA